MVNNITKYDFSNVIGQKSNNSKKELYNKYLKKFFERIVSRSSSVYLPESMPREKQIDSLNLYSNVVQKWSSEIIDGKDKVYEFENVLNITTPKNFTETIVSTIAEYVVVDRDVHEKYVENIVGQKVDSGESYESIYEFIAKEFSKEDFFDEQNLKDMSFKVGHLCSIESEDVVNSIRKEVEDNVKATEQRNQIFRRTLEIIEEKKDEMEEKNGIKTKDKDKSEDEESDKDKSGESYISLENAIALSEEVDEEYFEIDGTPENISSDMKNVLSTSGEEDSEGSEDESVESDEESAVDSEQEGNDDVVSEEAFCKKIAPKSLNKFINAPSIVPKKLVQYALTKEDLGNELFSNIRSRINYLQGLAIEGGLEGFESGSAEVDPVYIKLHELDKSLTTSNNLKDSAMFDLQNIGFKKLDELDSDEPFGEVVLDALTGKPQESTEGQLVSYTLRINQLNKEIRGGRNIKDNLETIGSLEEFVNETLDTLEGTERNILESRLKSLRSLESSIDFEFVVDTNKLKESLEKKAFAKDKEAFEKNGEWTDDTTLYKSVLEKLNQDEVVKKAASNVELEYIVNCALNGDNPCNSTFERILSRLKSSEGYDRLKEGQQYNVGRTILTTLVAANTLGLLSEQNRRELFTM